MHGGYAAFPFSMVRPALRSTLLPYTTLFRSFGEAVLGRNLHELRFAVDVETKRSEEHTSELQSRLQLVCRLLPENNKTNMPRRYPSFPPSTALSALLLVPLPGRARMPDVPC